MNLSISGSLEEHKVELGSKMRIVSMSHRTLGFQSRRKRDF